MAKQPKGELVILGFDYAPLEAKVAAKVRSSATAIRQQLGNTLESAIKIGQELLTVKGALPHGQFLPWLRAEIQVAERTAYYFMSVAERFKLATIANLPIDPTAGYLLAAPSAPDKARQTAVERAEGGEKITPSVAREILAETRKKRPKPPKTIPMDNQAVRLLMALERYRKRWNQKDLAKLANLLRAFADELDAGQKGAKKKPRGLPPLATPLMKKSSARRPGPRLFTPAQSRRR
jgi:hypothetical protein